MPLTESIEVGYRLQDTVLTVAEQVFKLISTRSLLFTENREYFPSGNKDPQALLERELDLIDKLPGFQDSGKPVTQIQKESLLKKAKANSPIYMAAVSTSRNLQTRLSKIDAELEAKQVRLRASMAALSFHTAVIRAESAQEPELDTW